MAKGYTVYIEPDCSPMNPAEWGSYTVISFCRNDYNYEVTETAIEEHEARVEDGSAVMLDKYKHSDTTWSLTGTGPTCRWDTARGAGLLLSATGEAIDIEHAKNFLEWYSQWCNGYVYCVLVRDINGELVDSCGGFYTAENIAAFLKDIEFEEEGPVFNGEIDYLNKEVADHIFCPN